jgi:hypothetical protein
MQVSLKQRIANKKPMNCKPSKQTQSNPISVADKPIKHMGGFGDSLAKAAHILSGKTFFKKGSFYFMSINITAFPKSCSENFLKKLKNSSLQ